MTIAELIKKLSTLPQNLQVATPSCNGYDVEDLNECVDIADTAVIKDYYNVVNYKDLFTNDKDDDRFNRTSQTPTQLVIIV